MVGEVFADPFTRLLAGGAGPTQQAAESWLRIAIDRAAGHPAGPRRQRLDARRAAHPRAGGDRARRERAVGSAVARARLSGRAGPRRARRGQTSWRRRSAGRCSCARCAARRRPDCAPDRAIMRAQLRVGRDLIVRSAGVPDRVPVRCRSGQPDGDGADRARTRSACSCGSSRRCCSTRSRSPRSRWSVRRSAAPTPTARGGWAGRCRAGGCTRASGSARCSRPGWLLIPRAFTSDVAVLHQAHLLWPWFVGDVAGRGHRLRARRRADRCRATSASWPG